MKFKYIMVMEGPIVFSRAIRHAKVELKGETPLSAGFVDFKVNEFGKISVHCYGSSDSLGLSSSALDEDQFMVWGNLK